MLKFSRDFKKILKEKKTTEEQFIKYCDNNMVETSVLTTEVGCIRILYEMNSRKQRIDKQMSKLEDLFKSFNPNNNNSKTI